ncbi:MAG TPA: hypothetical protein VKX16_03675, partial [Chloroflexota bacterium]|nr:hypothetical protein [Chloroflexota bacterium]
MSGAAAAEPAESLKPEPSIETAEPAAHFIPPQPPARVSRAEPGWPACCATSVMFGVAGLVFALHRLAETVLKEIVRPDPSLAFREVSD